LLSVTLFIVAEADTVQWADRGQSNRWRWVWCYTLCKTSCMGNSCLQGTEGFNHSWQIKVWQTYIVTCNI